jgi:hypothetical protein
MIYRLIGLIATIADVVREALALRAAMTRRYRSASE